MRLLNLLGPFLHEVCPFLITSALASSFVPPSENSLLSQTDDIGVLIDCFRKKQGITELTPEHLEGPAYEVVKAFHPDVMIQTEFFFNKDLEYLRFGHKGDRLALSITKMKAASYPDAGLEQMVPDQLWVEEEYMYDISASYGISHWWFKRQQFYIDRHSANTNQRAIVRTHMRILSVVRIEVFSLYEYDYMKKIVLRRADNQEYTIPESDFKDLQLMDKEFGYQKMGLKFMHDYKILDSPRAMVFKDKYGMQMIMRFNEIHKFSDGTLKQIDEALDYQQAVHVCYSEEAKAQANLPELGKLCWWTHMRRRLQTSLENRMITSSLYLL
ncbi:hypothetical protein Tco_1061976, partial [Tanacetum coccineum]